MGNESLKSERGRRVAQKWSVPQHALERQNNHVRARFIDLMGEKKVETEEKLTGLDAMKNSREESENYGPGRHWRTAHDEKRKGLDVSYPSLIGREKLGKGGRTLPRTAGEKIPGSRNLLKYSAIDNDYASAKKETYGKKKKPARRENGKGGGAKESTRALLNQFIYFSLGKL